ncbi:MAG: hypothetical protein DRJ10_13520 [Bacteroidetes bacterium]|nr:MAG: hypothetical protein DRJ10_13520 [Bacteroidota bacterium]
MELAFLTFFCVTFPALILYLCHKFPVLNKIGAILIAYAVGLIIGNVGILPEGSENVLNMITSVTIPLALPLLLFSSDVKKWTKIAGKTMLSLGLALVALMITIFLGYYLFQDKLDNIWQVSGMLVGVYTGGTPNLAAIQAALNVDKDLYLATHISDMLIGAVYFLFILSFGQRFFLLFLPKFKMNNNTNADNDKTVDDFESYEGIFKKPILIQLLKALGLSALAVAVGGGLSMLVPEKSSMAVAILAITTLGVLFSLIPKVNKLEKSFQLGMYLILVFSLAVAAMGNIDKLINASPYVLYYVGIVVIGTFIIHMVLSVIFKIDADTTIITTAALIMSPPFVPVVAGALKNRDIIISGLTVGIIGYAIGNYLGVFIAYALE